MRTIRRCARSAAASGAISPSSARAARASTCSMRRASHVRALQGQGKRVIVAAFTPARASGWRRCWPSTSSRDTRRIDSFVEAQRCRPRRRRSPCSGVEQGFETADLAVIGEQDILGDRLVRPRRKARRAADVITEATSLGVGDFVVHADHGIGRFDGLTTITALGAPHDCLEIAYAEGAKLYLPVENIELLSRYGSADGVVQLDRLGGVAWQTRKARLKQRIREIAAELIKVAALRQLRQAPAITPPARRRSTSSWPASPTSETEDQDRQHRHGARAISPPASPWTGWCAATSASARPRWRCAPPSSPR